MADLLLLVVALVVVVMMAALLFIKHKQLVVLVAALLMVLELELLDKDFRVVLAQAAATHTLEAEAVLVKQEVQTLLWTVAMV